MSASNDNGATAPYVTNAGTMSALELAARMLYATRAEIDGVLAFIMREIELEKLANGEPVSGPAERSGERAGQELGRSSSPVETATRRVLNRDDIKAGMPATFGGPKLDPAITPEPAAAPTIQEGAQ